MRVRERDVIKEAGQRCRGTDCEVQQCWQLLKVWKAKEMCSVLDPLERNANDLDVSLVRAKSEFKLREL